MSDVRLCPSCGTRRMGAFRYCLSCRLDYDALGAGGEPAGSGHEPEWPDPDEARAAILAPGYGTTPVSAAERPDRSRARPPGSSWMTNAMASLAIVALIGVAFGSTGLVPVGAGLRGSPGTSETTVATPTTAARPDHAVTQPPPRGPLGASASGPTTHPTPPALAARVVATPVAVTPAGATLRGGSGTSTWSAVEFAVAQTRLTWTASSDRSAGCALRWTLQPPDGSAAQGQLKVDGKGKRDGQRTLKVKRGTGRLVVTTDCAGWTVVLTGAKRG